MNEQKNDRYWTNAEQGEINALKIHRHVSYYLFFSNTNFEKRKEFIVLTITQLTIYKIVSLYYLSSNSIELAMSCNSSKVLNKNTTIHDNVNTQQQQQQKMINE